MYVRNYYIKINILFKVDELKGNFGGIGDRHKVSKY